jgi:hypothetical protein
LEANPEEINFELEHEEVPKEEAAIKIIRVPVDPNGDRYVAVRRL